MIVHALPDEDWGEVIVSTGFFYRVNFGPGVKIRHHYVYRGQCSCRIGENCSAVKLVQAYLANGGEPTPAPPDGFHAVLPHQCPICGATVQADPRRNSPARGTGWQCLAEKGHYWQSLGRQKQPACRCFVYPFAHEPGSGICQGGKQVEQVFPPEIPAPILVPV